MITDPAKRGRLLITKLSQQGKIASQNLKRLDEILTALRTSTDPRYDADKALIVTLIENAKNGTRK